MRPSRRWHGRRHLQRNVFYPGITAATERRGREDGRKSVPLLLGRRAACRGLAMPRLRCRLAHQRRSPRGAARRATLRFRSPTVREGQQRKELSVTVGLLPPAMFAIEWWAMKRERIDKLLVDRGLAHSRTRAQALVMAGVVLIDEQLVNKPSQAFAPDANIRLKRVGDAASR